MIDVFVIKSTLNDIIKMPYTKNEDILITLFKRCNIGQNINAFTVFVTLSCGLLTSLKGLQIFCIYTGMLIIIYFKTFD